MLVPHRYTRPSPACLHWRTCGAVRHIRQLRQSWLERKCTPHSVEEGAAHNQWMGQPECNYTGRAGQKRCLLLLQWLVQQTGVGSAGDEKSETSCLSSLTSQWTSCSWSGWSPSPRSEVCCTADGRHDKQSVTMPVVLGLHYNNQHL